MLGKLLHFFEAFSTSWFLYCNETNHHLVFYLLEIFNNIIQYQFDGNSNLIYTILRKRHCFHTLANLPTDYYFICKSLNKPEKKLVKSQSMIDCEEMEYAMHNCDLLDRDNDKKLLKRSNSIRSKNKQLNAERMNKSVPGTPVSDDQSLIKSLKDDNKSKEQESIIKELENEQDDDSSKIEEKKIEDNKLDEELNDNKADDQNREQKEKSEQNEQNEITNQKLNDKNQLKRLKENRKDVLNQHFKGWRPTSEWVTSWKKKLPLQTIMVRESNFYNCTVN